MSIWYAVSIARRIARRKATRTPAPISSRLSFAILRVAHVYLGSWPGGNYVRIVDERAGWSTAYAHLDSVAVTDGQSIGAGGLVGTVGSTGMASGPHVHYEVWRGSTNVDPTGLIECR